MEPIFPAISIASGMFFILLEIMLFTKLQVEDYPKSLLIASFSFSIISIIGLFTFPRAPFTEIGKIVMMIESSIVLIIAAITFVYSIYTFKKQ